MSVCKRICQDGKETYNHKTYTSMDNNLKKLLKQTNKQKTKASEFSVCVRE